MEKQNSKAFYVIKAFAILSVIFAQCSYHSSPAVQAISSLLGTIGVPIFLISSGVFFNALENGKAFWLKKLKTIICPWIIFGFLTYLVSVVLGSSFSLIDMFFWWIGYGTWMYFVTILLICYVVFRAIRWNGLPYLMIALFIVSNVLDVFGVNPITNLVGSYLNVFTRIGYFAIGILLKKANVMSFHPPVVWKKLVIAGVSVVMGALYIVLDVPVLNYFIHLIFILSVCAALFFWSQSLADCKLLQSIGKQTYFIYFVHMQLGIAILNKVMAILALPNSADWAWLVVRPVAILFLVYAIAIVVSKVMCMLKLDKFKWIIGIR